jgi:hypothetical protein
VVTAVAAELGPALDEGAVELGRQRRTEPDLIHERVLRRLSGCLEALRPGCRGRRWCLEEPPHAAHTLKVATRLLREWLGPPAMVGVGLALLVWIYWAGSVELTFWLDTSAYRVVDSVMLATAVALPFVVERLVRSGSVSE